MKRTVTSALMLLCPLLTAAQQNDYTPKIDGTVKARVEMTPEDGEARFNVRNARLGVGGKAGSRISYRMQVDLSNEGGMIFLDGIVTYTSQNGDFDINIGQQRNYFSTDSERAPRSTLFANRSFISKYLTTYHGSEVTGGSAKDYVRTLGVRELGVIASYRFIPLGAAAGGSPKRHLLMVSAGLFGGTGINNPQWDNSMNFSGRVDIRPIPHTRLSASYYTGHNQLHNEITPATGPLATTGVRNRMDMLGFEAEYARGRFFAGGEFARRTLHNVSGGKDVLTMVLVQSRYFMPIKGSKTLSYWGPSLRWDMGDNIDYINLVTSRYDTFDANRITAALGLGFAEDLLRSELRLNYEKFIFRNEPADKNTNKLLQDKITLEFVASF